MRVLCSVVAPSPAFMAMKEPKMPRGRAVGSQVIGYKLVWNEAHFLEQFPHQFQCSPLALNKNIKDFAFGIDGTP
jgi:hypothetical protein